MAELIRQPFGLTSDRREVDIWTLRAGRYAIQVLTYGGILRSWMVPAPEGSRDIVLGCETLAQYEAQDKYLGALVGRVANRIGGASFELNGVTYPLAVNNGPNCLHGGLHGFNEAVWKAREEDGVLVLSYVSPAGEEGFPGTLRVQVTYTLTEEGALTLDYQAESDADTLCSLTNHSYFNLLGHAHGPGVGGCHHGDGRGQRPHRYPSAGGGDALRFARSGGIPARPVSGASPADPGQWL